MLIERKIILIVKEVMPHTSAGILIYCKKPHLQILLAHPGGPYWSSKDEGAWTIPKGEPEKDEELIDTARRECLEEIGLLAEGDLMELGSVKQKGGKTVYAWAWKYRIPDDFVFAPGYFEMEWPPNSGHRESFPEIDRIEYFGPFEAKKKINPAQVAFISRLIDLSSRQER